jgi:hypothetical protein
VSAAVLSSQRYASTKGDLEETHRAFQQSPPLLFVLSRQERPPLGAAAAEVLVANAAAHPLKPVAREVPGEEEE